MTPIRRSTPASCLFARAWTLPGVGPLRVELASTTILEAIDRDWPPRRAPSHVHHHWRWAEIDRRAAETFVVLGEERRPVAAWASGSRRTRSNGEAFYRLDYLEIDPDLRKSLLAALVLALVCVRASELRRDGVILASLPETAAIYERFGAQRHQVAGWKVPAGLLPFLIASKLMAALAEESDEHRDEEEDQS